MVGVEPPPVGMPPAPSALDALVQQAVAKALALPTAASVTPLMSITPLLGLKMPSLDDPALVTDLNDNFLVLDNAVTTTASVTLTNKTIDHGILIVPAIDDFSLAQHAHQTPAGGGALDGAAIATGTVGTGNLVRESAVGGGPGTIVDQPVLLNPAARDTLFFGPVDTAQALDTALQRSGPNALALGGSPVLTQTLGDARYLRAGVPTGGGTGGKTLGAEGLTPVSGCDPEFRQSGTERYELVFQAGANGYASINLTIPQAFAGGDITFRYWTWSPTTQSATWRLGGAALADASSADTGWAAIADRVVPYTANLMTHHDHVWAAVPASYAGYLCTMYVQCLAPPGATRLRAVDVRFGS